MELRIQQLRKRKGVTQVELAHACETTQQQIAKIESGLIDLKISTLQKIAKALDCEIPNLFYTKEEFLNDVLAVIKNQKVDLKKVSILELNTLCYQTAKIPALHPYWEKIAIKGNKLQFKEEK